MARDTRPRLITPRNHDVPTRGAAAGRIAARKGRPFLPWQQEVADVALEYHPDTGLWLHPDVVGLVPRQAGKTTLVGSVMDLTCQLRSRARVWFTMQTGKDASDWFKLEYEPSLEAFKGLYTPRMSTGSEAVVWRHNQSVARVFPPQRDALHSKQSDLVVVDEAWAHDAVRGADLLQAIGPTQATRTAHMPGAQVWTISAAGDAASGFLIESVRKARTALEAGTGPGVLFEYGVPLDLDPDDLLDPAQWSDDALIDLVAAGHPGVGILIAPDYLGAELGRMGRAGFLRAYGCVQVMPETVDVASINPATWKACAWHRAIPDDDRVVAFGVDIHPERRMSAILAVTAGGILEVVDARPGVEWVYSRYLEVCERWRARGVVFRHGSTANLWDTAVEAGQTAWLLPAASSDDVVVASQGFYDALTEQAVRVRPHPYLDDAARTVGTRKVGTGWAWAPRKDGPPIAPLMAASWAWWGATRGDRTPEVY